MNRISIVKIIGLLCLVAGLGLQNCPPSVSDWSMSEWSMGWFSAKGPITQAIVIEETATRTTAQSNVLFGKTSQALRDASKWKLWDKDHIPASFKATIEKTPPKSIPWLYIEKGGSIKWNGALPESETAFSTLITKQGGVK